jgi:hypothetical protein
MIEHVHAIFLIFQQTALARPKGIQPVVSNHRLSAVFSFSRRLSSPKPFEPVSFQLVVVQFTGVTLVPGKKPGNDNATQEQML